MSQQESYKTFRVNINTTTLLDNFAPVLIEDITNKLQPIFQLQKDYCAQIEQNCTNLQAFPEFSTLTTTLREYNKKLKDDFYDCEDNIEYFTLVFVGAVNAGKTSMICDFLNMNPDQLNKSLQACDNFIPGNDDVTIAGEVATANIYEFLVDSSRIRLVDVPGTGGVVHDNTTLAPFVNKADCVIFLSNASSDLTSDDYGFVLNHIVGLPDVKQLTPETASNKRALVVVNKWNTVIEKITDEAQKQRQWEIKKEWILWGDSKKEKGWKFKGLSELFKTTLTIVSANTSQRILNEKNGDYKKYGEAQLEEITDSLKSILREEGVEIKLERPRNILNSSLFEAQKILANERTKCHLEELVAKLDKMGFEVTVDSSSIMLYIDSRLENLQNRLKNELFHQISSSIEQWQPSVSLVDRFKGIYPKEWWGSEIFGAQSAQDDLKSRWKTEIQTLLKKNLRPDEINRTVREEAESIGKLLENSFKAQLTELQNQTLKDKLDRIGQAQPDVSDDGGSFSPTDSGKALEAALNKAVGEIQYSIIDDIIGILTIDGIIAALIGAFLTPVGGAVFIAIRRWMSGRAEEKKAKRNIEEKIWFIADEVSSGLQKQVADKLRGSVQSSVDSITQVIEGERDSLSKLLQSLDEVSVTVNKTRDRLDTISK
jgi:hypothetical protein